MSSIGLASVAKRGIHTTFMQHRRLLVIALVLVDATMVVAAFSLAFWLRFFRGITLITDFGPPPNHLVRLLVMLLPLWLFLFAVMHLYDYHILLGGTTEYSHAFQACTSGMMIVIMLSFFDESFVVSRAWLLMTWLLSVVFVFVGRFVLRRMGYAARRAGYFTTPALIVGTNREAHALADQLMDSVSSGLRIVGLVDSPLNLEEHAAREPAGSKHAVLGTVASLPDLIAAHDITEVIVATTALRRRDLFDLYTQLEALPDVQMRLSSGLYEVLTTNMRVHQFGMVPLLSLSDLRLGRVESLLKSFLDYGLALGGLIVATPLLLALTVAIKLDSRGPVFHRRRVLGTGGKQFDAYKFRTMFVNGDALLADQPDKLTELRDTQKIKDDPRITRIGALLRKTSLDELPQLFNVLLGQMSLVGPRMITPEEAHLYGDMRHNLLTVKPGLTGLWQVSGRSDLSYEERVRLDMHYIRNYTIWLDLQILFIQTPPAVLRQRGAY